MYLVDSVSIYSFSPVLPIFFSLYFSGLFIRCLYHVLVFGERRRAGGECCHSA